MSYRCTISFKIIEPADLYLFLLQYKQECRKNYANIAEENCLCSPVWRENQDTSFIDLKTLENAEELERKTEIWAKNHVFKYRWFYFADKKLLGIYAVPTSVYHLLIVHYNFRILVIKIMIMIIGMIFRFSKVSLISIDICQMTR